MAKKSRTGAQGSSVLVLAIGGFGGAITACSGIAHIVYARRNRAKKQES